MTTPVELSTNMQGKRPGAGGPAQNPLRFDLSTLAAEAAASGFRYLQRQRRQAHAAGVLALFATLIVLDLMVDRDFSLYALYLIPALYAIWFLGNRWGYGVCAASALVWLSDDLIHEQLYRYPFASYWNVGTRAAVLAIIVGLMNLLKDALEKQDELRSQQVQREFEMAREVQLRLLPSRPPSFSGLDLSCLYQPALVVGGDYYDFVQISPERLCIVVADISGKGLPSALLLMASLKGLMQNAAALQQSDISRFAHGLNASLYKLTTSNRYATLFLGIADAANGTFEYINAGHNPPFLFRSGRSHTVSTEFLDHAGLPLCMVPNSVYERQRAVLRDGDALVLYTDGVTEAQNAAGDEFGAERLRETVTSALALPAAGISERVKERLEEFVGQNSPFDDITLVVVKKQAPILATKQRNLLGTVAHEQPIPRCAGDDSLAFEGDEKRSSV